MRRLLLIGILFSFTIFLVLAPSYAAGVTQDKTFNEIKEDLKIKGMIPADVEGVKKEMEDMLEKGATKDEIEKPALGLSKNGVTGKDLRRSIDLMNDLIKSGKAPKEAGNIVSQAVHQAQAEGLRGTALADKVHEAIKEMQAEKRESIETKEERKETENVGTRIEEGSEKGNFSPEGHGGGMGNMGGGHGHNR